MSLQLININNNIITYSLKFNGNITKQLDLILKR